MVEFFVLGYPRGLFTHPPPGGTDLKSSKPLFSPLGVRIHLGGGAGAAVRPSAVRLKHQLESHKFPLLLPCIAMLPTRETFCFLPI